MKTISTKYIPASNTRGSRIKVTDGDFSRTYSYPSEAKEAHLTCAERFFREVCTGWNIGKMLGGHTKTGMVFICEDSELIITK